MFCIVVITLTILVSGVVYLINGPVWACIAVEYVCLLGFLIAPDPKEEKTIEERILGE